MRKSLALIVAAAVSLGASPAMAEPDDLDRAPASTITIHGRVNPDDHTPLSPARKVDGSARSACSGGAGSRRPPRGEGAVPCGTRLPAQADKSALPRKA